MAYYIFGGASLKILPRTNFSNIGTTLAKVGMGVAQSSLRAAIAFDDCLRRNQSTRAAPGLPFSPSECLSGNYDATHCSTLTVARGGHDELIYLQIRDVSGELRFVCKGLGSEAKGKSSPVSICDAMGEPLCVVERVSAVDASTGAAVVQGRAFRVVVKGDAVAEITSTRLYTAKPNKLDPGFVYSVGRRELLSVTRTPDVLRGRRIVLRRTVADAGTQEAPLAGSMVGSSTRLGASWTVATAPAVDVLAVLSIFVALTCMGGEEAFGRAGKRATPVSSPSHGRRS